MTNTTDTARPKKRTRMARPASAPLVEDQASTAELASEPAEARFAAPTRGPQAAPAKLTKSSIVIDLLSRPGGVTIAQLCEATGWQAHSVRGFMAGALKKKDGVTLTSDKPADERIYRLVAGSGDAA